MLTPGEYDRLEEEAKLNFPVLYQDQLWTVPDHPIYSKQVDFPLRVSEYSELGCLLNRFQIDRYYGYMSEIDGLTETEIQWFKNAIHKLEIIGTHHLKNYDYPMDQLMASLAIHRKIRMAKEGPISILELGPGAGLTSLFFGQDPEITKYTQIESTQSLYLLQELINEVSGLKVEHLTWWQEPSRDVLYDVFTANSCLCEITDKGLARYLDIFDKKYHDKTLLLVQDPGGEVHRTDRELLDILTKAGWHIKKVSEIGNPEYPLKTWWFARTPTTFKTSSDFPNRQILDKTQFTKIRLF